MKLSLKKKCIMLSTLLMISAASFAESPVCGEAQDASWMEPEVMQQQLESLGYTIDTLDVSAGNCYQVTGLNVQGKSMTAYLDPRTGDVLQENIVE